jgi:transcriptional regulator with XRE-family HTH domain
MAMIIRQAEFARRLMAARVKQELRAVDVIADLKDMGLRITRQTYSNWEHGFSLPKREHIDALSEILVCKAEWLRDGDANEAVQSIKQIKSVLRQAAKDLSHIEEQLNTRITGKTGKALSRS